MTSELAQPATPNFYRPLSPTIDKTDFFPRGHCQMNSLQWAFGCFSFLSPLIAYTFLGGVEVGWMGASGWVAIYICSDLSKFVGISSIPK